jgi:hypothetical protein
LTWFMMGSWQTSAGCRLGAGIPLITMGFQVEPIISTGANGQTGAA